MQYMLQVFERRMALGVAGPERDAERHGHARQRRVHAGLEHADPHYDPDQDIGSNPRDPEKVEGHQHQDAGARQYQGYP